MAHWMSDRELKEYHQLTLERIENYERNRSEKRYNDYFKNDSDLKQAADFERRELAAVIKEMKNRGMEI